MTLPAHDADYVTRVLLELLRIPSPSGFTEAAVRYLEREVAALGLTPRRTPKGALLFTIPGENEAERTVSAHVDTLGALVKEIKPNGRLKLSAVGGYDWATIEGAECQVHGFAGERWSGTVINTRQSSHVHGSALRELKRDEQSMEVRLDVETKSAETTRALGVSVGNFVSFDSLAVLTDTGFVKGRHLDNKASVAIALAASKALLEHGVRPAATTHVFVSTYEEVGHGAAAGIPETTRELLCLDMAAVGEGQTSDEYSVTICAKDSSGPYDYAMNARLMALAKAHDIPLRVDIYPYYGSDASASWRAGGNWPAALIGPGIDASHAFERTHVRALAATTTLLLAYLVSPLARA